MKRSLAWAALAALSAGAIAQDFSEGFDDVSLLAGMGWDMINHSDSAQNNWFQGNDTVFAALSGAGDSYIGANWQFTGGTTGQETLSGWLITPMRTLRNGDTFSFWTRTVDASGFPDRLQLRLSTNGASSNVGSGAEGVGDFSTLLVDVNSSEAASGYPETWTQYSATVSGLNAPTDGRFALRYYVHNGGFFGANSNYIGVDDVNYDGTVPEPATLAALGIGALMLLRKRR